MRERNIIAGSVPLPPPPSRGAEADDDDDGEEEEDLVSPFLPALWSMEPRIFSVEKSSTGKRRYVVGHLGRFLDLYWRKTDPRARHYYELIREGTPCRLYFDLEYGRAANPDVTDEQGDRMTGELVEEICVELERSFGIGGVDRSSVVDLDSSTSKKFSRHLIFHLPGGVLFEDAPAVGAFVKSLVGRLADEIGTGELYSRRPALSDHLFVRTGGSGPPPPISEGGGEDDGATGVVQGEDCGQRMSATTTCFVDLGVYTRNRLFRLMGSAKYGKPPGAALRIADANCFPFPEGFRNESFYLPRQGRAAAFEKGDEAAGDGESGDGNDDYDNDDEGRSYCPGGSADPDVARFRSGMDWADHAEALAATLVVPVNGTKIAFPIFPPLPSSAYGDGEGTVSAGRRGRKTAQVGGGRGGGGGRDIRRGASPFPPLDDYVADVLGSRGGAEVGVGVGPPASVRAWSVDDLPNGMPGRITYQMKGNRYCENMGREHR